MPGKQSEPVKPSNPPDKDARDDRFQQTVRRMLETPPKAHEEMKMGDAQKRGTRSRGKGSKS